MTTFTDDDLRRLKEDMERLGDFPVGNYRLRPLLARLEAAEEYCGNQRATSPENQMLKEDWHKRAGK